VRFGHLSNSGVDYPAVRLRQNVPRAIQSARRNLKLHGSLPKNMSMSFATTPWCLFGVYFYWVRERNRRMDRPNRKVIEASVDATF
jgi:hypothetical protein